MDHGEGVGGSESEEEPQDFDRSASEFWKLFRDEANNHDDARIDSLKKDMDSSLIFVRSYSVHAPIMDLVSLMRGPTGWFVFCCLTAFVVESIRTLKPRPADEMVYYLQQHSTILSQISVQLSSIAPQVPIPSTPPPPFPPFSPSASDLRVNVFWFMALVFSLLAALLAILVQQWVRKYMHVFKRYGDPLRSSRVRQYLYEGCETWSMPKVAEAVPGFLHVSLFLFFAGLGDSLLKINTKVALSTIVPIGVSGLLYTL
ncbi:hypothetical protein BGY98DRAFT_926651, partial [Russula aff. rugulosa BPL654]